MKCNCVVCHLQNWPAITGYSFRANSVEWTYLAFLFSNENHESYRRSIVNWFNAPRQMRQQKYHTQRNEPAKDRWRERTGKETNENNEQNMEPIGKAYHSCDNVNDCNDHYIRSTNWHSQILLLFGDWTAFLLHLCIVLFV